MNTVQYTTQLTLHTEFSTNKHAKVPHHGFLAQKVKMAGSEPLIQEAHHKASNRSSDVG